MINSTQETSPPNEWWIHKDRSNLNKSQTSEQGQWYSTQHLLWILWFFKFSSKKSHLPLNELILSVYMVHSTVLKRKLQGVCCQHLYDSCQQVRMDFCKVYIDCHKTQIILIYRVHLLVLSTIEPLWSPFCPSTLAPRLTMQSVLLIGGTTD